MKTTKIVSLGLVGLGLMMALGAGTDANAKEVVEDGKTYWQVEAGDTLSEVGIKYGIHFDHIVKANNNVVTDPNMIFVGDKLLLPLDTKDIKEEAVITEQPVVEEPVVIEEAPAVVEEVPVAVEEVPVVVEEVPVASEATPATSNSAKEWIAQRESSGSYDATNGRYIGRYQLTDTYLNGDYSPANQERVADEYVAGRYGSWENAQSFWIANGWY